MSYSDIERRIKRLYISIDTHRELTTILQPNPTQEESFSSDGKKQVIYSFGGRSSISEKDEDKALTYIYSIIENIGKLKDNIKKPISEIKPEGGIVKEFISSSNELSVLYDLWNKEKHPKERFTWTTHSPKIKNIRRETVIKPSLANIYFNPISNSESYIEADIVDSKGSKLYNLTELLKLSVNQWEKFIQQHLPKKSTPIETKKESEELLNKELQEKQAIVDSANIAFSNGEWLDIHPNNIRKGMILKRSDSNEYFSENLFKTLIVDITKNDESQVVFIIIDDFFGKMSIIAESVKWKVFKSSKDVHYKSIINYFKLK